MSIVWKGNDMKVNNRCVEIKIVYWTQRVFSKFHETYLTTTVHETFEGKEIKLVDNFVKDLLSKEDVYAVYVKEVKTLTQTTIYKG